jgi:hypothetical protein
MLFLTRPSKNDRSFPSSRFISVVTEFFIKPAQDIKKIETYNKLEDLGKVIT